MNRLLNLKRFLVAALSFLTLMLILLGLWAFKLDRDLRLRIEGDWFLPPVEIYSAPSQLRVGQTFTSKQFSTQLTQIGLRERGPQQKLLPGDFARWQRDQCQTYLEKALKAEKLENVMRECVIFFLKEKGSNSPLLYLVIFTDEHKIGALYGGQPLQSLRTIKLKPHLFAQFYGNKPILRQVMQIEKIPLYCLQAVTAIEDLSLIHI